MKLKSKVGLITGGSSGIGFETAKRALEEGAQCVIITGQDPKRLKAAEEKLNEFGKAIGLQWRADDLTNIDTLSRQIQDQYEKIDFIFANAGVCWGEPLGEIQADTVQKQFLINVTAPLLLIQSLTPLMKNGGSIALTTSCVNQVGSAGFSAYAASKAALRSLARTLSAELKDQNIRVNALAPGPFETPIYDTFDLDDTQKEELKKHVSSVVPMGRFGQPHEIADAAVFLLSDGTSYMLGEEITIDGGWANL